MSCKMVNAFVAIFFVKVLMVKSLILEGEIATEKKVYLLTLAMRFNKVNYLAVQ